MMKLEIWTIYKNPPGYSGSFIARKIISQANSVEQTNQIIESQQIESLQNHFEQEGKTKIPRSPDDDPSIIESWI